MMSLLHIFFTPFESNRRNLSIVLVFLLFLGSCHFPQNSREARKFYAQKALSNEKKLSKKSKAIPSDTVKTQPLSVEDTIKTVQSDKDPMTQSDTVIVFNENPPPGNNQVVEEKYVLDSFPSPAKEIVFSPDSLSSQLNYDAVDTMIYDLTQRKIYLYGSAHVTYESYKLEAGYIELDFNTFTARAQCIPDSLGNPSQFPLFNDGNQEFESSKMEYNFKSKKGKVYEAITRQGDGYFLSDATKFISKDPKDSTAQQDVVYSGGSLYTTCNHKHPHFGIRTAKAKVIPNKLIVIGPSYLEIMGSPTPLVLPFGFFPISQTRRSGLILSTNIDFSPVWGLGIRGIGYYWAINENIDLSVTGDVYSRGTFRVNAVSNYNKLYKANGAISLGFALTQNDIPGSPDYSRATDFNISWNHSQSQKAHPSQTFSASVNFGTSNYYRNTTTVANNALQSTLQSNISFTKRFLGSPFSLAIGLSHSQNTSNRLMTITLPKTTLTMNQIFPLKRKKAVGQERWYERIGLSYSVTANNTFQVIDSLLFTADGLANAMKEAKYSIVHSPNLNMSFKVLKHINIQPSISYRESWYFYSNEQNFNNNLIVNLDTTFDGNNNIVAINSDTLFGQIEKQRDYGFSAVRDFSVGVTMNTQMYATGTFNILGLHKIRAVIRPNVGMSWRPDFSDPFWGYYGKVQTDIRYPERFNTFSRFDVVPAPGEQSLLNYSLNMRLEGKIKKSKADSSNAVSYKNVILLNNLNLSSSYNLAADSFQMSPISINANTSFFKFINATLNMTLDPYSADPATNRRINVYEWNNSQQLFRLTSTALNLSAGFSGQTVRSWFQKEKQVGTESQKKQNLGFEFLQACNISYNLRLNRQYVEGKDSLIFAANEIAINGSINLSKGWNITISRIGYDFTKKRITYPDFTFSRNLHCWEMGLSWQPEPKTWNFFLRVRPGSLGFINLPFRKTQFDPF